MKNKLLKVKAISIVKQINFGFNFYYILKKNYIYRFTLVLKQINVLLFLIKQGYED